jgi:hypothetical protein
MPKTLAQSRAAAFSLQSGRCYYCSLPMCAGDVGFFAAAHGLSVAQAGRLRCTAEHMHARCDGGSSVRPNIVAACLFCNGKRHKRKRPLSSAEYKAFVEERMSQGRWHPRWVFDAFSRARSAATNGRPRPSPVQQVADAAT